MPKFFFNYPNDSACPYHRLLLPARHCAEDVKPYDLELLAGDGMPPGHDAYFFHGLAHQDLITAFQMVKRRGGKFVWGVDDDWTCIPDWNPAKPDDEKLARFELLKNQADWILTSTPHLAKTFDDVREKVLYAPNLCDVGMFPDKPYTLQENGSRVYDFRVELPIKILWSGSHTHKGDIECLTEPVARILDKYPRKVVVVYQGMQPQPPLLTKYLHRGLFHQPPVPFAGYQSVVNNIRADVVLAPLAECEFNLSKSNLRVMEGWGLMAPPVATPWGEYNCVRSGVDGRFAGTPDEWYSVLSRLATDHEYRLTLAANGRQRLEEEYNWDRAACRGPWVDAFKKILESL